MLQPAGPSLDVTGITMSSHGLLNAFATILARSQTTAIDDRKARIVDSVQVSTVARVQAKHYQCLLYISVLLALQLLVQMPFTQANCIRLLYYTMAALVE